MKNKRLLAALCVLEEISCYEMDGLINFNRKKQNRAYEFAAKVYEIAHAMTAPDCLKNHPGWDNPIKEYLKAGHPLKRREIKDDLFQRYSKMEDKKEAARHTSPPPPPQRKGE